MSIKCLFGHKWLGCKCTRCGKTRDENHFLVDDKCGICGIKMIPVNSFTKDEISMLSYTMTAAMMGGKQFGEKDTETHAKTLGAIFMLGLAGSDVGRGLTQSNINFIGKYVQTMFKAHRDNGNRLEAEKYDKLLSKLLEMKNSF